MDDEGRSGPAGDKYGSVTACSVLFTLRVKQFGVRFFRVERDEYTFCYESSMTAQAVSTLPSGALT